MIDDECLILRQIIVIYLKGTYALYFIVEDLAPVQNMSVLTVLSYQNRKRGFIEMKRMSIALLLTLCIIGGIFSTTAFAYHTYFSEVIPDYIFDYPLSKRVTGNNVQVRKGPGINYTSLGEVNTNDYVYVNSDQYTNWDWGYPSASTAIAQHYLPYQVDGYVYNYYLGL